MGPLDELYFQWLYKQVAQPELHDETLTYWKVLRVLFKKEIDWFVINDENRIADGKALRLRFRNAEHISELDPDWVDLDCSVLELMVGLSLRIEHEADGQPHYWFWVMMNNLGLNVYNDSIEFNQFRLDQIQDILDRFIYRRYEYSGLGGLFPLQYPHEDQRDRELWYQMNDYVLELLEQAG